MNINQMQKTLKEWQGWLCNTSPVPAYRLAHEVSDSLAQAIDKLEQLTKERDEAQDNVDEEWLNEIGRQWLNRTGQPWETRDGETREEGLQANITALFQVIEDHTKERDDAQAKCAEMREALKAVEWIGSRCSNCGGTEHTNTCLLHHALSADCGKGWKSPEEYAALEAKCAEMRIALEHCRQRPHEHNPISQEGLPVRCEIIDRALSTDCGRGYVPVSELDRVIGLLDELLEVTEDFLDDETGHWTKKASTELARLQALKKKVS